MRGWQLTGAHQPLKLVYLPDPIPKKGEIAIDIKAAGLCHSDVGLMEGITTSALAFLPIIIGHEFSGIVTAVGEGVTDFKVGDKVSCTAGYESPGVKYNGAYANKTVALARICTKIPDNVDWMQAAAATDAGITAYHAVAVTAGVKPGDKVGIVGLGGLGLNGAQIAKELGGEVYCAEIKPEVREAAAKFGFAQIVADVNDLADFNLDVIIDFAGFAPTIEGALRAVRYKGTVVLIGLGSAEAKLDVMGFVGREITLKSSIGGTVEDLKNVLNLIAEKKLEILSSPITFEEIPDGLERLKQGKVVGRLVAMMD